MKEKTLEITRRLKEEKILIRRPFEESFLGVWNRITIGPITDSERFIQTLSYLFQIN